MELEMIRDRLDALNWQTLLVLSERLMLVREVAAQKKAKGNGVIHAPSREAAIFDRTIDHCRVLGLDADYVLEIVSLMIAHAKDAECDVLGVKTFLDTSPKSYDDLQGNLLKLTSATAQTYMMDYCDGQGADAIRSYLSREKELILETAKTVKRDGTALDLGTANGRIVELLEPIFAKIQGIDICPQMIDNGKKRRLWQQHVSLNVGDLHREIPVGNNEISFVVANFGAASEISSNLLPEIARILSPGGKAFLSFYNRDAISNLWYYPWPSTLRAHLNTYNDTLEVWYKNQVYVVYGKSMTVSCLKEECANNGLTIEWVETYPTFLSIVPRFFFSSERFHPLVEAVLEVDESLTRIEPHRGTHITAVISKT